MANTQGGAAGACGDHHSDDDHIVAMNNEQYDKDAVCGKKVSITNTKNGKTMEATVVDLCPDCAKHGPNSLDLSTGLFTALGDGDMGQGLFPITWSFA